MKYILFILLLASAAPAADFYVSTSGSDTNNGSRGAPLRRIQAGVDRATYGDCVHVLPGLYREQVFVDGRYWPADRRTGSATNRCRVEAFGQPVIIQSSELVTNWTVVNSIDEWNLVCGDYYFQKQAIYKTPWAQDVNLVMQGDGHPLRKASSLTPGAYTWNSGKLYVWTTNATSGLEVGGFNVPYEECYGGPWWSANTDYLELAGIHFRYANTGHGGSGVALGRWNVVDNCLIDWMDFQGLSCWNSTVTNCSLLCNGCKGLENAWTNAIVANCVVAGNNWRQFSMDGQAAGAKFITRYYDNPPDVSGLLISGCLFATNRADAIWLDSVPAFRPALIVSNTVVDNWGGIQLELCSGVTVAGNTITGNRDKGILVACGSNHVITANTVLMDVNADLSSGALALRTEGELAWVRDNVVTSNLFSVSIPQAVAFTGQDGPTPDAAYFNNVYAYNVFTNQLSRFQLNVWEFPYRGGPVPLFRVADFETMANGTRVHYGNRPGNPNVGNR